MRNLACLALLLTLAAPTLAQTSAPRAKPAAPELEVHFIELGTHGESILIKAPAGKHILIDTGLPIGAPRVVSYLRAQKVRTLIKRDFEQCFDAGVHAMLTPATPTASFGVGEKGGADPVEMYLNDIFTVTVNMAGLPGIAVPAGSDAQGLPLGLQLIGRPFDEETLFSLSEVIEQAAGRFVAQRWW